MLEGIVAELARAKIAKEAEKAAKAEKRKREEAEMAAKAEKQAKEQAENKPRKKRPADAPPEREISSLESRMTQMHYLEDRDQGKGMPLKEMDLEEGGGKEAEDDDDEKDAKGGALEEDDEEDQNQPTKLLETRGEEETILEESAGVIEEFNFSKAEAAEAAAAVVPTWMSEGVEVKGEGKKVSSFAFLPAIVKGFEAMGISKLFPVQSEVIPAVITKQRTNDICVASPTGSGKTLAYVVPIVQVLAGRAITRLRALVVVPSRELVAQVYAVFDKFCPGVGLKVAMTVGQTSFAAEQALLVDPGREKLAGGCSKVDILICTPGRLIDHLHTTPGFTLQHLRFLVIDEADKLLSQYYYDWVHEILDASYGVVAQRQPSFVDAGCGLFTVDATCVRSAVTSRLDRMPLQKVILSATLPRNPQRLASLHLHNPLFFSATTTPELAATGKKYTIPPTLVEKMLTCRATEKPLVLVQVLERLPAESSVLCFTKSLEATHRLQRLLELFGLNTLEFSSRKSQRARDEIVEKFRSGECRVLVCSDALARGIDLKVDVVISYDVPAFIRTYIHRVGRTARAGQPGTTITMIQKKSARYFKLMLKKAEGSHLKKLKVDKPALLPLIPKYQACLKGLAMVLKAEQKGEVREEALLSKEFIAKLDLAGITATMTGLLEDESEEEEINT